MSQDFSGVGAAFAGALKICERAPQGRKDSLYAARHR
jgi:hypothetical protein